MVISRIIGLSMAEQVDRVNRAVPLEERLRQAKESIRILQGLLAQRDELVLKLSQRAQMAESQPTVIRGIAGQFGSLTTPRRFADLHHTSVSTVNRALNSGELMGIRQPNDRWLVYADLVWTPKRKRGESC